MDDIPYTTPEEDPFNVQPLPMQPRRRRSSLLDKWIQEQQKNPDDEPPPTVHNHPYLAYPELGREPANPSKDDVVTLDNYDLVNDDDIPQVIHNEKEVRFLSPLLFFLFFVSNASPIGLLHSYNGTYEAHLQTPPHTLLFPQL